MMWPYPYVHKVGLNDYIIKILFGMNQGVYACHVNVWSECYDAYGLLIGLLSMCEVMELHMYIALVDLDWDCE